MVTITNRIFVYPPFQSFVVNLPTINPQPTLTQGTHATEQCHYNITHRWFTDCKRNQESVYIIVPYIWIYRILHQHLTISNVINLCRKFCMKKVIYECRRYSERDTQDKHYHAISLCYSKKLHGDNMKSLVIWLHSLVPWLATTETFRPLPIALYYCTMQYLMPR